MASGTSSKFRNHREPTLEESKSLFWGICCESGKKYSQVVRQRFQITMAALEPDVHLDESSVDNYVSLMVERAGCEYLLCNLKHNSILQVNLNLLFDEGEVVTFFLKGQGTVHLSGYHVRDNDKNSTNKIQVSEAASTQIPTSPKKTKENQVHKSPVAGPSKVEQEEIVLDGDSDSSGDESDDDDDDEEEVVETPQTKKAKKPTKSAKITTSSANEEEEEDSDEGDDDDDIQASEEDIDESEEKKPKGSKISLPKKEASKDIWESLNSMKESSDSSDESSDESEESVSESKNKENERKKLQNSLGRLLVKRFSEEPEVTPVKSSVSSPKVPGKSTCIIDKSKKFPDSNKGQLNSSIGRTPMPNKKRLQSSINDSESAKKMKINFPTPKKANEASENVTKPLAMKTIKTKHGDIQIYDIRQGCGPKAKFGKFVHLQCVGKLKDGSVFTANPKGTKPFSFKLGCGDVIGGLDAGIAGMSVGGKRKIIMPYSVAYGKTKVKGVPFGSTLTFLLKLQAVS